MSTAPLNDTQLQQFIDTMKKQKPDKSVEQRLLTIEQHIRALEARIQALERLEEDFIHVDKH